MRTRMLASKKIFKAGIIVLSFVFAILLVSCRAVGDNSLVTSGLEVGNGYGRDCGYDSEGEVLPETESVHEYAPVAEQEPRAILPDNYGIGSDNTPDYCPSEYDTGSGFGFDDDNKNAVDVVDENEPTTELIEEVAQTSTEPVNETNIEPELDSGDTLAVNGRIVGNIIFNGITVSQLFEHPFAEILGPPLERPMNEVANFSLYEGFELVAWGGEWDDATGSYTHLCSSGSIAWTDVSLPEINGISFDRNMRWYDINDLLGNPLQYYADTNWVRNVGTSVMSYQLLSGEKEFLLEFWFEHAAEGRVYLRLINIHWNLL